MLLTYSLSVLQLLAAGNTEEHILRNLIQSLKSRTTAVLQWIPAHTGIHGNEVADQLVKEGSKKQQPNSKLSYQESKTLIRNKRLADFKHRHGGYNPHQDILRILSRHEQTMIFRLRTGHCRLRSHMKKIGINWKHKLQPMSCIHALSTKRKAKHWANQKFPMKRTLWNSHLCLTVRFIALTELQI